jgi:hypothetical protein
MKNALLATTAGTPIEVWFQDEARVGQKGSLTYIPRLCENPNESLAKA